MDSTWKTNKKAKKIRMKRNVCEKLKKLNGIFFNIDSKTLKNITRIHEQEKKLFWNPKIYLIVHKKVLWSCTNTMFTCIWMMYSKLKRKIFVSICSVASRKVRVKDFAPFSIEIHGMQCTTCKWKRQSTFDFLAINLVFPLLLRS